MAFFLLAVLYCILRIPVLHPVLPTRILMPSFLFHIHCIIPYATTHTESELVDNIIAFFYRMVRTTH